MTALPVRRTDYLEAAMELLATEGAAALKVGRLCRALGITTGSFYHHFDGLPDFTTTLLDHWERENTQRVADALGDLPALEDAVAAVGWLKEIAVALPHAAEAAIRGWSLRDPEVAAVQRRVDREREDTLTLAIGGVVGDEAAARDLAVLGMTILVGFQQARDHRDTEELRRLLDLYEKVILDAGAPGRR